MNNKYFTSLMLCSLIICLNIAATAATGKMTPEQLHTLATAIDKKFMQWMVPPWQANDRFFAQERKEIEDSIQHGTNPSELMRLYETDATKSPVNSVAQFRYYYAAYEAAIADQSTAYHQQHMYQLGNLDILVVRGNLPKTYNYVRLEFLCATLSSANVEHELEGVGVKLLAKEPADFPVKYGLTALLVNSNDTKDNYTALKYALEMVRQYPSNPRVYGMLGGAYRALWLHSNSKADANKAITAYQKYLALAPQDAYFRPTAEMLIDKIKAGQ